MTVSELYVRLSQELPESLALPGDKNGIMCSPNTSAEVKRVLFALDATEEVVTYAERGGFDLIIVHHPMIFSPIPTITSDTPLGRTIVRALRAGISVISFHTIADSADGGVNDILAARLGLSDVTCFAGEHGRLGRVGETPRPIELSDFALAVKDALSSPGVIVTDAARPVSRVAVIGGSGKSCINEVFAVGADTFVTGELSHAVRADARAMGLNLVEAGHFHTEAPVCELFRSRVKKHAPDVECEYISSCSTTVM